MKYDYSIITPAFNECRYIETTIQGVLAQTVQPKRWIIVDDGSTDATPDIVKKYAAEYLWIEYIRREKIAGQTYFASNVYAIECGYEMVKGADFDFLGILDADISLPSDYYEKILSRMIMDKRLGIASGVYEDNIKGKRRKILNDRRSTPKALMIFRRECYQEIEGLFPLKYGGEDTYACITARMKGWKTWSFPDIVAIHNKPVGTGHGRNMLQIRFRQGYGEYYFATHPIFMLLKSLRRCIKETPYILGGIARILGYIYASIRREDRQIPSNIIDFIRHEQVERICMFNRLPRDQNSQLSP
jgi:poly-beta-1,6-N-acetyl-D-glucosamine synthase